MSQPQRAAFDRLLRDGPLGLGGELAVRQTLVEDLLTAHPLPEDVKTTPRELGGAPALCVETVGTRDDAAVLCFHGGAYAVGSAASSVDLAAVARSSGFPALTAYRGLLSSGVSAERVAVGTFLRGHLSDVRIPVGTGAGAPA
ncbi:hypothetical protein AB0M29_28755 [Streptomyces sp. NPDC051976]|uniref:hypothetical protein n=1 Tax=Streptomyces sp. NPDC051976 TaxID=3154947 RepID=UPI00343F4A2C